MMTSRLHNDLTLRTLSLSWGTSFYIVGKRHAGGEIAIKPVVQAQAVEWMGVLCVRQRTLMPYRIARSGYLHVQAKEQPPSNVRLQLEDARPTGAQRCSQAASSAAQSHGQFHPPGLAASRWNVRRAGEPLIAASAASI